MNSILKEEEEKSILIEGETKSILIDPLEKIIKNSILVVDEEKLRKYREEIAKTKMEIALKRYDIGIERARIMNKYPDLIPYFIHIIREQEENYEPIN